MNTDPEPKTLKLSTLDDQQIAQIKELSLLCGNYEPYYDEISADGIISFFLHYEGDQLVSYLSCLCMQEPVFSGPRSEEQYITEAEITGMTHPDFRHRGFFRMLLNEAKNVLTSIGISDIYCNPPTELKNSGLCREFSHKEYLLSLDPCSYIKPDNEYPLNKKISFSLTSDNTYFISIRKFIRNIDIGICHLEPSNSFTNIWGVKIIPHYRRLGYGSLLMRHVIEDYFSRSSTPLILHVSSRNTAACSLYFSLGFKISEQIEYYRL